MNQPRKNVRRLRSTAVAAAAAGVIALSGVGTGAAFAAPINKTESEIAISPRISIEGGSGINWTWDPKAHATPPRPDVIASWGAQGTPQDNKQYQLQWFMNYTDKDVVVDRVDTAVRGGYGSVNLNGCELPLTIPANGHFACEIFYQFTAEDEELIELDVIYTSTSGFEYDLFGTFLNSYDPNHSGGEEPGGEEPGTEEPGGEKPGTEEPGTEEPGTEEPGTEEPGGEKPGTEKPGGEKPGGEKPGTEKPGTEEPGTEDPGAGNNKPGAGGNGPELSITGDLSAKTPAAQSNNALAETGGGSVLALGALAATILAAGAAFLGFGRTRNRV